MTDDQPQPPTPAQETTPPAAEPAQDTGQNAEPVRGEIAPPAPEGEVFGADLESALRERVQAAAGGEKKYWSFNGEYYELQPTMPAGAVLAVMEATRKKQPAKILEAIVAFFEPAAGEAFIEAVTTFSSGSLLIDMEYLNEMMNGLFKVYGQRPLAK